jgi:hypothetical protein
VQQVRGLIGLATVMVEQVEECVSSGLTKSFAGRPIVALFMSG